MRLSAVILALATAINLAMAVPTLSGLPAYQRGATLDIDLSRRSSPDVQNIFPRLQRRHTTPQLIKRIPSLQIHHMKIHQMVIPVRFAALYLSRFYSGIVQECLTRWVYLQPMSAFTITHGPFRLTVRSSLGPVPWLLVSEVALNLKAVTALGFTGTYDVWYTDFRGAGVVVGFRIRPGVPLLE